MKKSKVQYVRSGTPGGRVNLQWDWASARRFLEWGPPFRFPAIPARSLIRRLGCNTKAAGARQCFVKIPMLPEAMGKQAAPYFCFHKQTNWSPEIGEILRDSRAGTRSPLQQWEPLFGYPVLCTRRLVRQRIKFPARSKQEVVFQIRIPS